MIKNKIKKFFAPTVKLSMENSGSVIINSLPYTFSVQSVGKGSDKGFAVSLSGDDIDNENIRFDKIQLTTMQNGHKRVIEKKLTLITKSDGKMAYNAKFKDTPIPASQRLSDNKTTAEQLLALEISNSLRFSITAKMKTKSDCDIMITVYPYENIIDGAVVEWKTCTADENYFTKKLK